MPTFPVTTPVSPADAPSLVANGIDWASPQARGLKIHLPGMGREVRDVGVRREAAVVEAAAEELNADDAECEHEE